MRTWPAPRVCSGIGDGEQEEIEDAYESTEVEVREGGDNDGVRVGSRDVDIAG